MKQIVAFLVVCSIFISCSDKKRVVEEENLNFEILSIDDLMIGRPSGIMYNDSKIILSDMQGDSLFHLINLKERTSCQVGKRGNGPNEFLDFDSFYRSGEQFGFFDSNLNSLIEITFSDNDVLFSKKVSVDSLHYRIVATAFDTYIGVGPYTKGLFSLLDAKGKHVKKIGEQPYRDSNERRIPELARAMAYQGKLSVSPDGCYLVHAIYSTPMISFYRLQPQNIEEIGEDIIAYPVYKSELGKKSYASAMSRHNKLGFMDVVPTDRHIYAILSNRTIVESGLSAFLGNIIMKYDWNGNLVKKYVCNYDLMNICITPDEKTLYAVGLVDEYELLKADL